MGVNPLQLIVDDHAIPAQADQNLLEACLSAKLDVPYFCWHPALGSVGSCRQCAVKTFSGPDDTVGQIVMSCMTQPRDQMRVSISDPEATAFRASAVELVLTNHPHDCPVCEVGGECHLQDMTVLTGHTRRRYRFTKRTHLNQDLGPLIRHEMNRCIGCYRCVRFYQDYAGGKDFGVFGANRNVYFGRAADGALESPFAGNLVEVCPTGVFVDKPFSARFRRKWDMRGTPSVCVHCAVGCNITINEREGQFRRVTNRYNSTLNGYFLCDRGRFGSGFIESDRRLRTSRRRTATGDIETISASNALDDLAALLRHDQVIGIGSPRASLEANFALRTLVGSDHFYAGLSDDDAAFLVQAIQIMRDPAIPTATLQQIQASDAICILGDDPSGVAPRLALALRQAASRAPRELLDARQIPTWHDSAARLAAAGHTVPLIIATPLPTEFDELATVVVRERPETIAALAYQIAHEIDPTAPKSEPPDDTVASRLAEILNGAKNPLIVVGGTAHGVATLKGAANVVTALRRAGIDANLSILLPEANSVGLGLMAARPLSEALSVLAEGRTQRVIVIENDLSRRLPEAQLGDGLNAADTLCVLDHIETSMVTKADLAIAVGSFADSDGTFITLEGRAQRFFKAIFGDADPPQTWQVLRDAGIASGRLEPGVWPSYGALIEAIGGAIPALAGYASRQPSTTDAKPATLPYRYSGRTAVTAHRDVREPKPPAHLDSPLGTTMEGPPLGHADASAPFFWSPGWNSAQAVNKFQDEIGGALTGDEEDWFVFETTSFVPGPYFALPTFGSEASAPVFVPITAVFGSEELSALAPAIAARMEVPILRVNPTDLRLVESDRSGFEIVADKAMPIGVIGITTGFPGVPFRNNGA